MCIVAICLAAVTTMCVNRTNFPKSSLSTFAVVSMARHITVSQMIYLKDLPPRPRVIPIDSWRSFVCRLFGHISTYRPNAPHESILCQWAKVAGGKDSHQ